MSVKSSTVMCHSNAVVKVPRNCWESTLNIAMIKSFQNDNFRKEIAITVTEVVLIQFLSLTVVSKHNTRETVNVSSIAFIHYSL